MIKTKTQAQVKEVKQTKQAKQEQKQSRSTIDKKLVVKLFKEGKTAYQIAKQIGKYYSQVAPILEKEGFTWQKRPEGPTDKKSHTIYCNDEQLTFIKKYLKENKYTHNK